MESSLLFVYFSMGFVELKHFGKWVLSLQGKSGFSTKDSTLFGFSLSDNLRADLSSSSLRCKVKLQHNVFH